MSKRIVAIAAAIAMLLTLVPAQLAFAAEPTIKPYGLLTNELERPINVPLNEKQSPNPPFFSWWLDGEGLDLVQTAYQIQVTDDIGGAVVWDSGKVESAKQSYVLYSGPVLAPAHPYSWTVRVWDGADAVSEYAAPAQFATGVSDADWTAAGAEWLYVNGAPSGTRRTHFAYFRADQALAEGKTPVRALAYFSAVHDYELNVNGSRIGRGMTWDYLGEQRYQGWDITDAVKQQADAVTLAVITRYQYGGQGRAVAAPGMIGRVDIYYDDGTQQTIVTNDDSWRMIRGTADDTVDTTQLPHVSHTAGRNAGEGVMEDRYDATKEAAVEGWKLPGTPTEGGLWQPADARGTHPTNQFTHLIADPSHVIETVKHPVSVVKLEDGTTVADFGVVIPARMNVAFENGVAGNNIVMYSGFQLTEDGHVDWRGNARQSTTNVYRFTQKDGAQTYNEYDYLGFRYFQVPDCGEDFTADEIWATILTPEVPAGRDSSITTSDNMFNQVFDVMKRSALYSIQVGFVDTPTREQGQFLQDGINVGAAVMTSWFEREKTRKAIMQFLDSADRFWTDSPEKLGRYNAVYPNNDNGRDIPDYTLNMPLWIWEYYMQTGDIETLEYAYPYMVETVGYAARHIPADGEHAGLVSQLTGGGTRRTDAYYRGIIDWPNPGRFGYEMNVDNARSTINMLSVQLFDLMSEAANVMGKPDDVATFKGYADALRDAVNAAMIVPPSDDPQTNADNYWKYTDGVRTDGTLSDHYGQHSTSYALAFDVAPEEYRESMLDYVSSMGMAQGPMTVDFLVEALCEGNRPEALLKLLTNTEDFGWADTIVNKNGTFTWEQWTEGQSQSHGWGAASLVQLYEYVAGVKAEAPAATKISINPMMAGVLDSVEGSVATESGVVTTAYSGSGNDFRLTVDVPVNVQADVKLPVSDMGVYYEVNGQGGEISFTEDYQVFSVGSGTREFAFQPRTLGITAPEKTAFGDVVEYTLEAIGMDDVNLFDVTFEIDGARLEDVDSVVEGLGGFNRFENVKWTDLGDDKLQGNVVLGMYTGVTANGDGAVGKLSFDSLKLGNAEVKIVSAIAYGIDKVDESADSSERLLTIDPASATSKIWSVYDLNDDAKIDNADLSLGFYYYLSKEGDENWEYAKVADVDASGDVDMTDLLAIYANYMAK